MEKWRLSVESCPAPRNLPAQWGSAAPAPVTARDPKPEAWRTQDTALPQRNIGGRAQSTCLGGHSDTQRSKKARGSTLSLSELLKPTFRTCLSACVPHTVGRTAAVHERPGSRTETSGADVCLLQPALRSRKTSSPVCPTSYHGCTAVTVSWLFGRQCWTPAATDLG